MKKIKDPRIFLNHILDTIEQIEEFLHGINYQQFLEDDLRIQATARGIEIIGEAVKNLNPEIRKKYTHVPWRAIAGMRDMLIHEYFQVDFSALWKTAKYDLPRLKKQITTVLLDLKK